MRTYRWAIPFAVLVVASLGLVGFGPPALVGSDTSDGGLTRWSVTASAFAEAHQSDVPAIQATGAAVVDGETGTLVWGKNPHQSFAPASMTKMMTALIALQHGSLTQVLTSNVDAAKMTGDSVMGLHPGERLSLRDLLYGLLVPSGDDAAIVIAESVAGSQDAFVALMNDEAARLGLTDTHFVNPHGLDAPGHVSSPNDMVTIGRAAMNDSVFRQIVATQHIVIHGTWTYDLTNTNYFLGRRAGIIGIKTGTTDLALHAITVAESRDGNLMYLAVMHTPNYVPDVTALLDYFDQRDAWVALAPPPTSLPSGSGAGQVAPAVGAPPSTLLPRWKADARSYQLDATPNALLRATDNPDLPPENAGAVTLYAAGDPVARIPLAVK